MPRLYQTKAAVQPKTILKSNISIRYNSTGHRMLLYAKFKGSKGFTRMDWTRFHPEYRMRQSPLWNIRPLLAHGLVEVVGTDENQRFFITPMGELKLIHMAEAKVESERKRLSQNAQHLKDYSGYPKGVKKTK